MKKYVTEGGIFSPNLRKLILKMKLTAFIILFFVSQTIASSLLAQVKFSIEFKNSSVEMILLELEIKSELGFMYNKDLVDVERKVNIDVKDASIDKILQKLFPEDNVTFYRVNNQIVISPKFDNVQQQNSISGTVTDEQGESLPGVTILVKGTTNGTVTNFEGEYTIADIPEGTTLQFSFVGMVSQEIVVGTQTTINVTLVANSIGLEEVVAIGYGTQKKGNLTGSVASVKSERLTVAPVASTSNALAGLLPGLVSKQSSGQPGADAASLSIRGFGNALVIVDGIESSFNNIDANQIASVSILKDGAASIYGARAGNGVILVTTKRGAKQKPTITLTSSKTFQGVTNMLKPVSSGQMVELAREAHFNGGGTEENAPYTLEAMQKYYEGTDPMYPNTDWYKELMRDWAPQQQHNLSVSGGSEKIKYYGFLGFMDQETMIKKNGGNYRRYNLQSNIDAKITDELSLQLDIASIFEEKNYPARPMGVGGHMWQDYWTTQPIYPAHFPDPDKVPYAFGAGTGGLHVTSNSELSGYNKTNNQNFKGTLSLTYDIKAVEGLSVKAFGNYNQNYVFQKIFTKPVDLYTWDPSSDVYTQAGSYGGNSTLDHWIEKSRTITTQLSVNYKKVFNEIHRVSGLALFESIDLRADNVSAGRKDYLTSTIDYLFAGSPDGMSNNGSAVEMGRESFVGRLNYAYKDKYLVETIIRADASAKFSEEQRWGYFPSVSLGWMMSEEGFMESFEALDNLKLRVSYGESGNDAVGNFQYLSGYEYSKRYLLGNAVQPGISSTGLANPMLTWEQIAISNAGVDFSFFNRKIYGELDVFYRERSGIPSTRLESLPSTFGATLPQENLNSINNRGFELNLGTSGEYSDLKYSLNANISWSRAKWDYYEEPEYSDPEQARIFQKSGRWVDEVFGYKSNGLFSSQAEIDALTFDQDGKGNSSLNPGDIRFVDVNGDEVLDWKDQVEVGQGATPHWMCGLNINLKYKSFDLSALFQGAFGYNLNVSLGASTRTSYELRWTEENNDPNAMVPRVGSNATTAGYFSDYLYQDASYLRLKTMSLGYNLPQKWVNGINISSVRFFAAGTNLFTLSKLTQYGVDPEAANIGWYYPQQRTISLGVKISL